jgi:glycine cleavage system aminomethyltransferase T
MIFTDPRVVVLGKEPILIGDRVLGYVTSANYGYSIKRSIAYGYLPLDFTSEGTEVDIWFFGQLHRAVVSSEPLFDPKGFRLKQ